MHNLHITIHVFILQVATHARHLNRFGDPAASLLHSRVDLDLELSLDVLSYTFDATVC